MTITMTFKTLNMNYISVKGKGVNLECLFILKATKVSTQSIYQ